MATPQMCYDWLLIFIACRITQWPGDGQTEALLIPAGLQVQDWDHRRNSSHENLLWDRVTNCTITIYAKAEFSFRCSSLYGLFRDKTLALPEGLSSLLWEDWWETDLAYPGVHEGLVRGRGRWWR